jgi:hypothetical protein
MNSMMAISEFMTNKVRILLYRLLKFSHSAVDHMQIALRETSSAGTTTLTLCSAIVGVRDGRWDCEQTVEFSITPVRL